MEYEAFHADSCSAPKLLRFQGLPTDYSIKARVRSWLGYVLPFDRHDWVVDRCGKEVRYIIDFYNGPDDPTRPATVHLDVRPAPTPGGVIDRARMWWKHVFDI
jgi:cytochrome c heme-lyase